MCYSKIYTLILIFIAIHTTVFGQNIDSLLLLSNKAKTSLEKYKAQKNIIQAYNQKYEWNKMQPHINQLIQYAKQLKDTDYQAEAYRIAGFTAYYQNLYSKSDSLLVIALKYATKKETKARIYDHKFQIFARKGEIEKGAVYLQKMRENIEDTTSLLMSDYYLNLSNYYGEQKKNLNKLIYLQKAKKIELQHGQDIRKINYNLTNIFNRLNAYENALSIQLELREQAQKNGDNSGELFSFFGIMTSYDGLKEYDKVKQYGYEAINLKNRTGVETAFGYVYYLLGCAHLKEEQLDSAAYYFTKGVEISERRKEAKELGDNHSGLCELYYIKGDFEKAKFHGEEVMKHISYIHQGNNSILGKIYAKTGDYKRAYELLRTNWSDWEQTQKERRDYELIANLINEKFEGEIETLRKDKELQALTIRSQNYLVIIGVVLILLFGGIGFFFWKQNQYRKTLTEKQEKIIEQERETNEAKTRFFSNVSHELKTPLSLIINPIQKLLRKKDIPKEEYYLMKSIQKNSLQLFDLIQQVLELGKFEFNHVAVNETALSLSTTVRKLFGEFESYAALRKVHFQLTMNLEDNLIISTDQYKFTTILKNLISNALKHTPEGGKVTLSVLEKDNQLIFSVQDTGMGIHQNDLPHIFDRYYQAKMRQTILEGGTGIGLTICKEYVNLLGGDIQVASNFGSGSVFTVSLPKTVATTTAVANMIATPVIVDNHQKIDDFEPLANRNDDNLPSVLVVEDNIDLRAYLQHILSPYFKIRLAYHGKEALKILNEDKSIELIVSDVMMPVMDGYELLRHLKQSEYAGMPVIMLTALSETDTKLKALRLGVDDYILKPFVDEELIARIENLLDNANQRKAYQETLTVTTSSTEEATAADASIDFTNNHLTNNELEWLEALENTVNKNLSHTNLSVEQLADAMYISRTLLFRKIKELVGVTPMQYIKDARLLKARQFLEARKYGTVKEVSYAVGFKDVKNFSRNFKKRFGRSPSDYLE